MKKKIILSVSLIGIIAIISIIGLIKHNASKNVINENQVYSNDAGNFMKDFNKVAKNSEISFVINTPKYLNGVSENGEKLENAIFEVNQISISCQVNENDNSIKRIKIIEKIGNTNSGDLGTVLNIVNAVINPKFTDNDLQQLVSNLTADKKFSEIQIEDLDYVFSGNEQTGFQFYIKNKSEK